MKKFFSIAFRVLKVIFYAIRYPKAKCPVTDVTCDECQFKKYCTIYLNR